MAAIPLEVPEYARPFEGSFGRGVQTGVDEALRQFVALIRDPEAPRVREVYVALGRGELRQGRRLDALQAAYRVGARVAWRRIATAARRGGVDSEALSLLAEAIFAYIDELSADSVEGYAAGAVRARGRAPPPPARAHRAVAPRAAHRRGHGAGRRPGRGLARAGSRGGAGLRGGGPAPPGPAPARAGDLRGRGRDRLRPELRGARRARARRGGRGRPRALGLARRPAGLLAPGPRRAAGRRRDAGASRRPTSAWSSCCWRGTPTSAAGWPPGAWAPSASSRRGRASGWRRRRWPMSATGEAPRRWRESCMSIPRPPATGSPACASSLGDSLDDPDARLELELALRAQRCG